MPADVRMEALRLAWVFALVCWIVLKAGQVLTQVLSRPQPAWLGGLPSSWCFAFFCVLNVLPFSCLGVCLGALDWVDKRAGTDASTFAPASG